MASAKTATIFIVEGEDQGQKFVLTSKEILIGRKEGQIILNDRKVSSKHAVINLQRGVYTISDLDSTNGTYLNGKKIESQVLKDGSEIQIGFSKLLFRLQQAEEKKVEEVNVSLVDGEVDLNSIQSIPLASEKSAPKAKRTDKKRQVKRQEKKNYFLKIVKGPNAGKIVAIKKDSFVLGRLNADLNIEDQDVSRKHALIEVLADDKVFVRDLASTNGTHLNGKRVVNARLQSGDKIQLGQTILAFAGQSKKKKQEE